MGSIIAFCGYGGAGKDYTCKRVQELYPDKNFHRFALADFLKEIMAMVYQTPVSFLNENKAKAIPDVKWAFKIQNSVFWSIINVFRIMLDKWFGFYGFNMPTFRQIMIDFSEQGVKKADKAFWVRYFYQQWKKHPEKNWIMTDMRYQVEYDFLQEMKRNGADIKFVFIDRNDYPLVLNCGNEITPDQCHMTFINDPNHPSWEELKRLIEQT